MLLVSQSDIRLMSPEMIQTRGKVPWWKRRGWCAIMDNITCFTLHLRQAWQRMLLALLWYVMHPAGWPVSVRLSVSVPRMLT